MKIIFQKLNIRKLVNYSLDRFISSQLQMDIFPISFAYIEFLLF